MNNWQTIWESRNLPINNRSTLDKLISIDGFDTGYGTIKEVDWKKYVDYVANKLNIERSSLYEVGCGAGAFLYRFHEQGNRVGGLDYSNNLIAIAKKYLSNGNFENIEAIEIDINKKYDFVISNSVFFYFPNYDYAQKVVIKMIEKSVKGVAILEISDYAQKEEAIKLRKNYLSNLEYEERYAGLDHLYYKKEWFIDIAKKNNLQIEIEQQHIANYKNNMYRFNVFIYKDC